uniref:Uncharacterized protein n=1 Tax=Timema shepardi TaxID=629360 RepID=A0A7R9G562_TIMSH|nr:unnamed protein product [Timema shepardi]
MKSVVWDSSLLVSLEVLSKLHKLNQDVEGLKVPYDTFHLSDLAEHVDINVDYLKWLLNKEPQMNTECTIQEDGRLVFVVFSVVVFSPCMSPS